MGIFDGNRGGYVRSALTYVLCRSDGLRFRVIPCI